MGKTYWKEHPSVTATRILECPMTQEKEEAVCICQDGDMARVARAYLDLLASVNEAKGAPR